MPAGAIVASASRVWIKKNSADRYPPPHPGYEEWWTEATTYAVPISNREVDEMLALGSVDLLRPTPAPKPEAGS